MAGALFELKGVRYSYPGGVPALGGVDLAITQGSKVAFLGANGTGKSTLLMLLDGLVFPGQGTLKAWGKELKESAFNDRDFARSFRAQVGFVFQNPEVQLFCPTVKEDIVFGPLQLGVAPKEIKRRLDKITSDLRITRLLERSPHQLSIGEKRKVAIASVLAIDPEVFLLDEPTAGLDPQTTRDIIDLLLEQNDAGKTIVTATHDMHILEEISDIVHVFSAEKKIVRSAASGEILADQEFLRAHNLVHLHRHRHQGTVHSHRHEHLEHHV